MANTGLKNRSYTPRHLSEGGAPPAAARRGYDGARYESTAKTKMKRRELITDPNKPVKDAVKRRKRLVEPVNRQLIEFAERSHELNRRRMRTGVVWLFLLPVLLLIIRSMTNSSKIAFLIIWIFGMFIISAFLLLVAYSDNDLQERLRVLQSNIPYFEDTELGKLSPYAEIKAFRKREQAFERAIREHIADRMGKEASDEEG